MFHTEKKKQNCSEVSHPCLHQGIALNLPPDPQPQSLLALLKTDMPIFFLYSPLYGHMQHSGLMAVYDKLGKAHKNIYKIELFSNCFK